MSSRRKRQRRSRKLRDREARDRARRERPRLVPNEPDGAPRPQPTGVWFDPPYPDGDRSAHAVLELVPLGTIERIATIGDLPVIATAGFPSAVDAAAHEAAKAMGRPTDGPPAMLTVCHRIGTVQHVPPDASTGACELCGHAVWVSRESRAMAGEWTHRFVCRDCIGVPRDWHPAPRRGGS